MQTSQTWERLHIRYYIRISGAESFLVTLFFGSVLTKLLSQLHVPSRIVVTLVQKLHKVATGPRDHLLLFML